MPSGFTYLRKGRKKMNEEEVIELVEQFRKAEKVKLIRESKWFINVSFYLQGYNFKWYKVDFNIPKSAVKEMR